MTTLYDARNALQFGQRHEAARLLARIVQREPTNAEAWYLLAEAVDDFQQQTYCMGMATRLGYRSSAPAYAQPESSPLLPPFVTPAFPQPPALPQIMPVMIVESRPRDVFDLPPERYPPPGILQRTLTLVSSLLALVSSVLALAVVSVLLLMLVGACITLSQLGQALPR
jgi:hypothetical protein